MGEKQDCNPDIYGGCFCGRGDLVTCGDIDENPGPHCSGCSLKNCVSCIDIHGYISPVKTSFIKVKCYCTCIIYKTADVFGCFKTDMARSVSLYLNLFSRG